MKIEKHTTKRGKEHLVALKIATNTAMCAPIKGYNSIPANGLDADVRRFITKFGRYQTASELGKEYESGKERSSTTVFSGVHNGKSDNDPIRVREQKRGGLPCESEEVPSDQAERIEALLSHPFSEEMVT